MDAVQGGLVWARTQHPPAGGPASRRGVAETGSHQNVLELRPGAGLTNYAFKVGAFGQGFTALA